MERAAISWFEAEPKRLDLERQEMAARAPQMSWSLSDEHPAGAWIGTAPEWPFDGAAPSQLGTLTNGTALRLRVQYFQGFPAQPAWVFPLEPEPPGEERLSERLHLNGDGSLCLIRSPADWRATFTAADLVEKAATWYLWYLAVKRELTAEMPPAGIYNRERLDRVLAEL